MQMIAWKDLSENDLLYFRWSLALSLLILCVICIFLHCFVFNLWNFLLDSHRECWWLICVYFKFWVVLNTEKSRGSQLTQVHTVTSHSKGHGVCFIYCFIQQKWSLVIHRCSPWCVWLFQCLWATVVNAVFFCVSSLVVHCLMISVTRLCDDTWMWSCCVVNLTTC